MSELVTGEAVVLGLRPAKLPSRGVAVAIDLVVWWLTYLVVSIGVVAATSSLDDAAAAAVAIATLLLLLVGLPIAVETLSRGRSLGKLICGLRVVRDDGGPIRFRHALVRGAVGAVEIQFSMGTIACVASLVSARGRRLGDVFAGTLVVRERVPAQYMQQPPPPPWVTGQMAGIDLSGLPEDLWLAIRQYLARMRQLDPQVGWTMAQRLAGDVAARTGKPVPEGMPPAAFLAAVVAERQARDAQRVFGPGGGGVPGGPVIPGGYGVPGPGVAAGWGGAGNVNGVATAVDGGQGARTRWAVPGAGGEGGSIPVPTGYAPGPGGGGGYSGGADGGEQGGQGAAATGFAPPA